VHDALLGAVRSGARAVRCSLDLDRSTALIQVDDDGWSVDGRRFPYLERCKDRTIYYWSGAEFAPAARFTASLTKLVPTDWGAPTFEIDGIKMLPTARVSPYADAASKVRLIRPRGRRILDTCGGLGYFAAWCVEGGAAHVSSFEESADVLWLRSLNPWSPGPQPQLTLLHADIAGAIDELPPRSFDAALHDPPRFGIAGELYSQVFYCALARVLKPGAPLFHYTGAPNKLTSGRDVGAEVSARLRSAGFSTRVVGDGVLAQRLS
jgi:predicted methyltransferase